jgi:hypothetical protein
VSSSHPTTHPDVLNASGPARRGANLTVPAMLSGRERVSSSYPITYPDALTQAGVAGGEPQLDGAAPRPPSTQRASVKAALAGGKPLGLTIAWINRRQMSLDTGVRRVSDR